jgi:hypothetical protein
MRSRVWSVVACTLVLALGLAVLPLPAGAQTITVDGNPNDWIFGFLPYNLNTGHVMRAPGSPAKGEYAWKDNAPGHTDGSADERTDFVTGQDTRVDLEQFRVTGDATNIYFLACMTDIPSGATSGAGAPQVQVAVDTNQDGSGATIFMGNANTDTHPNAGWETLLMTRFGSGNSNVRTWATPAGTPTDTGSAAISDVYDCIEFSVPWVQFGLAGVPTSKPLRLTVAIFRADASDNTQGIAGSSDALDAVTNYGTPCDTSNTLAEVSDGVVDYHFDLYFQAGNGEVMSPLLITEVMGYPTNDPDGEWIQIYNAWSSTLTLDDWKVGDEESCSATCNEGMYLFPAGQFIGAPGSGSMTPAYRVIAARNTGFLALGYSSCVLSSADYEIFHTDATPDMTQYNAWCNGGTFSLNNTSEQVTLLDPHNTVMDGINYGSASLPGVTSFGTAPGQGESMQRHHVDTDTNDCSADFKLVSSGAVDPCSGPPTAVVLQNLSASSAGHWLAPAALGLAAVVVGGVMSRRRRR